MPDDKHSQAVEAMARAMRKLEEAGRYSGPPEMAPVGWNLVEELLELLAYPGLSAVLDGSAVVVPRKLLAEAHACMLATGWQLAPASQSSDDGVIEAAVADIEERVGELLATPPSPGDAMAGDVWGATLGDWRAPAIVCRERGWEVGTRLVGDEGAGPTEIEITAIGERSILAKTISHRGRTERSGREGLWSLSYRDWAAVSRAGGDFYALTPAAVPVCREEGICE